MMTKEYICGVIRCRYGAAGVHYNRWRIANDPHFSVMAVYAHYIAAEGGVFDTALFTPSIDMVVMGSA